MINFLILTITSFLCISCVTEPVKRDSSIFIGANDNMVPILIQGYVMGSEIDEDNSEVEYPLKDVKVLVAKNNNGEGIIVSALSTNEGFFSISPDYVSQKSNKKYSYVVSFQKQNYEGLTKILMLPSKEASSLNVVLKRTK